MKKKIALAALVVVLTFGGLAGIKALQIMTMIEAGGNMGPFPETVEVRPVEVEAWEQSLSSIGTVAPVNGTIVRSEAEGVIREILFRPGSRVEAGAILVQLDTEVEQAQLEVAMAALQLTKTNVGRIRELHERQSVSDAELDRAEAEFAGAKATVANLQATVNKRTIRAPFAGRLGVREISPGAYINKGQNIVTLQSYDQVYVDMEFPQNKISFLTEGMEVRVTTDAYEGSVFTGALTALNPEVNPATRSISVQATFDNPDGKLLPGMFVNVSVVQPEKRRVIVVPRSAILHANYGDTLFVVTPAEQEGMESVHQQIVRLGESKGDFVEVTEGLEGDEEVVSAGAFKLREGSLIVRSGVGTIEPEKAPNPTEG
ncbi:efflux RND transporter periplasmic adaptor subunit [Puniceicoccales bacterium CK1056]|uniref:Efflux RND transporter periplasmic adaptor subunit n=1 Tax=Oceanipulchritudo coccoides TaxID=2706888 RepID=A0A6B2M1Q7_9BACT|nr:efflux RND transporter periplasmic adaptor subunit [Oceanipulchritudo coccoides]NDV62868.1 efflux RND transporter periplasmic adaptor subunit [Oceanipulchritudo coccoides]